MSSSLGKHLKWFFDCMPNCWSCFLQKMGKKNRSSGKADKGKPSFQDQLKIKDLVKDLLASKLNVDNYSLLGSKVNGHCVLWFCVSYNTYVFLILNIIKTSLLYCYSLSSSFSILSFSLCIVLKYSIGSIFSEASIVARMNKAEEWENFQSIYDILQQIMALQKGDVAIIGTYVLAGRP